MSSIYCDRFAEEYVAEKDPYAPPERYCRVFKTGVEGIYSLTYRLSRDLDQALTLHYTKEHEERLGIDTLVKGLLAQNGLAPSDIMPYAWMWGVPPSEYEKIIREMQRRGI